MLRNGTTDRLIPAAAALLLAAAAAHSAHADGTSVNLGEGLTFKPYLLSQFDEAGFAQSRPGGQAAGFNPRRDRLGGRLDIAGEVELGFIWDFGHLPGATGTLFEAKAAYTGLKPLTLTAGVFKTDFSLESMQAAGDLLMLERASIVTVTRNLAAGIAREGLEARVNGDRYNAAIAITAGRAGPGRDGNQRAVVGRAAGLLLDGPVTLHAGLSGEWVFHPPRPAGRSPTLSLSDGTELRVDDAPASLDTRAISATSGGAFGPEAGLAWRGLWLQAEYYQLRINPAATTGATARQLAFDGFYAQAAWTLLGHPRRWQGATGAWSHPTPAEPFNPRAGQFGAVEVGARVSTAALDAPGIRGGHQTVLSAVANWWPAEPLRVSLEYLNAHIAGGPSPRTSNALAARAQLQF